MSVISAAAVIFIGGIMIIASHKSRQETQARRRKEIWQKIIKRAEPFKKKEEKRKYIISLIDEIPELSYYEAAQLKKKLGDIYLEWNGE
jgi:hypothetical protein